MPNVVLIRTNSFTTEAISNTVSKAFDLLDNDFNKEVNSIIIKPNLCFYWDYSTGETTDPRVVSSVIDYLRDKIGANIEIYIAEADATAMRTKHAFKIL